MMIAEFWSLPFFICKIIITMLIITRLIWTNFIGNSSVDYHIKKTKVSVDIALNLGVKESTIWAERFFWSPFRLTHSLSLWILFFSNKLIYVGLDGKFQFILSLSEMTSGRTMQSVSWREDMTVSWSSHLQMQTRCIHLGSLGLPWDSFLRLWIFIFALLLSAFALDPTWSQILWTCWKLFHTSLPQRCIHHFSSSL